MKILYVLNSDKPGGMEQHVLDLIKGMVARENEVSVWCKGGMIADWYQDAGAKVYRQEIKHDIDIPYIIKIYKFMKKEKIDIVHAHELKAATNSILAAVFAGVKVRVSHTHTPISQWKIDVFRRNLNVMGYSTFVNLFATTEIALTNSIYKIKRDEGIQENKLVIISNGIDTARFDIRKEEKLALRLEIRKKYNIPQDAFVFGNISRLSEEKGHVVLLDAFDRFLNSEYFHKNNFYLIIAGGGILEDALRNKVAKAGMENRVIITGIFDYKDLVRYYSSFDVFVFPSLAEGFGIVLVEAMFFGLPIISSDLQVLKDVGGDTVTYFKTGDSSDLQIKMDQKYKEVMANDSKLQELARSRVDMNFTQDIFVNNYLNLYKLYSKKI